ncbi:MAG: FmdB family zinc ribbon protein [Thermoplasmatota archaeon]
MARLRCPSCGFVMEADPARASCPRCGWAPGQRVAPAASVAPTPAPVDGRRSAMATWAFVFALTPVASFIVGSVINGVAFSETEPNGPLLVFGSLASILAIAGPIAAIALGLAARRDPTVSQGSRNLALAAVIIGAVTLGLYVVAALLVILFIAACAAACGNSCAVPAAVAGAPCASLTATESTSRARAGRARRWADALAHHPDLPALRADVFRVAGVRLCVGCFTAGPVFLATLAATWMWPVPAALAWGAGLPLAALQCLSAAGWTATRASKVAVKASFGAGAALVLRGILDAPWPDEVRSVALAGAGLLAIASTRPRLRRIARLQAAAAGA